MRFARLFLPIIIFIASCSKLFSPPTLNLTEADQKFIQICKDDLKYDVKIKRLTHTLWIYNPIRTNIVEVKASQNGPQTSNQSKESLSLRYADTNFLNNTFQIEYDISKIKTYAKDPGYASAYSQDYQKRQSNILSTIQRSYFDVDEKSGEKIPEFIVLVISDIVNGIEIQSTTYSMDLKRALSLGSDLPQDEYIKRYLTEVRGNPSIIEDIDGKHLDYREITMPEFLAKQITNRIVFKYANSSFPPSADTIKEIATIVSQTVKAYNFDGFQSIDLHNLNDNSTATISKEELNEKYKAEDEGRLIEIQFLNPARTLNPKYKLRKEMRDIIRENQPAE